MNSVRTTSDSIMNNWRTILSGVAPISDEEMARLQITFQGMQEGRGGLQWPLYNDIVTKSTFVVHPNETVEQALERIRKPFQQMSMQQLSWDVTHLQRNDDESELTCAQCGSNEMTVTEGDEVLTCLNCGYEETDTWEEEVEVE